MSLLNPTTYLDLVQRSCEDCGINAYPATVLGNVGQALNFCNWVNQSWIEVQSKYTDWSWKRVTPGVSFVTVAGQNYYTPSQAGVAAGAVAQWARQTFRNYQTAVGPASEIFMEPVDYDAWRDGYLFGALRTAQVRPFVFAIRPTDFALCLQTPLAGYTITGDYFSVPTPLVNDADLPDLPNQYIMAIVYRTMMFYGAYESAPDVYNDGKDKYNMVMNRLEKTRLKEVTGCGPLA